MNTVRIDCICKNEKRELIFFKSSNILFLHTKTKKNVTLHIGKVKKKFNCNVFREQV